MKTDTFTPSVHLPDIPFYNLVQPTLVTFPDASDRFELPLMQAVIAATNYYSRGRPFTVLDENRNEIMRFRTGSELICDDVLKEMIATTAHHLDSLFKNVAMAIQAQAQADAATAISIAAQEPSVR